MRVLTEQISILASDKDLWSVMEDFGGVYKWAPYMHKSALVGRQTTGVGTCRFLRHVWGFILEEVVTEWTEGEGFSFDVYRAPYPMKNVHESWLAGRSNGHATVLTSVNYEMRLGLLGRVLDWILVRHIVQREMRNGLLGLKQYVEKQAEKITYQSTVIFADVAGSSRLYKTLGDQQANQLILSLLQRLAEIIVQHGGVVIKTIGDEIMAHIVSPEKARDAVVMMQQNTEQSLAVKIGMAWGDVIEIKADLFGQTVNDAAAVARIARAGQVITTAAFKDQLSEDGAAKLRLFDQVRLKGAQSLTGIYRIEWEPEDSALPADHTMLAESSDFEQKILRLTYCAANGESKKLTLSPEDTPFSIGRSGGNCRLEIFESFVSRDHCEIYYEHNKFILRDHSSNGTYITTGSSQPIFIRRGEFPLTGSGSFAVGRNPAVAGSYVIGFDG
jgi:adenylate cyclase